MMHTHRCHICTHEFYCYRLNCAFEDRYAVCHSAVCVAAFEGPCEVCGLEDCACCSGCDKPMRLTAIMRNTDKLCQCEHAEDEEPEKDDRFYAKVDAAYEFYRDGF